MALALSTKEARVSAPVVPHCLLSALLLPAPRVIRNCPAGPGAGRARVLVTAGPVCRRAIRTPRWWSTRWAPGQVRCRLFPPLWGAENSQQPVKRLCIAPRARTSWYVTCLEPPWALLPLEPRVRPLVGHFGLASIGTERTPHRPAYIIGWPHHWRPPHLPPRPVRRLCR